ncbi:MAG: hypothetical protein AAB445_00560, partial [Patescibacteria group bacterium]
QNFLLRRSGTLATKTVTDTAGVSKRFSDVLVELSRLYRISPKVLLVTLQKEQSLISDPAPTQRQFDYAMGYGCPDSGGCSGKAAGLFNQLDFTAWQFRQYYNFPTQYTYKVGGTYTFTDLNGTRKSTVTIENQATANLFNYTPHVYNGNYNFFNFYTMWFARQYPDGSLLRVGKSGPTWLIQNGQRRAIQTRSAFVTRFGDYSKILSVPADIITSYPRGTDIRLPNYSLVRTPDGHTYLLSGDEKRLIESEEVFRNLGFNPEEVEAVQTEDLASYLDGVTISNTSAYPAGALVRIKENGAITWIEQGVWYPILDRQILTSRFPNRKANVTITSAELQGYTRGQALGFRDGELVRTKGESGVYVISNGLRRAIRSREIAKSYGYNLKNVLVITPRLAELHPVGLALDTVQ